MKAPPRIVVLDDVKEERQAISRALKEMGYATVEVWNMAEAMQCAAGGDQAFIIDVDLPSEGFGNAGLVLVGRLHKINPAAFIGVYSGKLGENQEVARELGASVVIRKNGARRDAVLLVKALLEHQPHDRTQGWRLKGWISGLFRSIQAHWLYDFLREHLISTR